MAFIPVFCCARESDHVNQGVPVDAAAAATQVRAATTSALASGRRTMLVDVLVQSVRRNARTFDAKVYGGLVASLCRSLTPALSESSPYVKLCLPGPGAVLDVRQHFDDAASLAAASSKEIVSGEKPASVALPDVEIEVLGAGSISDETGALVIVDPPGKGRSVGDLRRLVREATAKRRPVLIMNHPQPGSVFEIADCLGDLPYEIVDFESVYTLAPFALRVKEGEELGRGVARFVLLHAFPGAWQLWLVREESTATAGGASNTPDTVSQFLGLVSADASKSARDGEISRAPMGDNGEQEYKLCEEWREKPSEDFLFKAVKRAMRNKL